MFILKAMADPHSKGGNGTATTSTTPDNQLKRDIARARKQGLSPKQAKQVARGNQKIRGRQTASANKRSKRG